MPNFVKIGQAAAEIWLFLDFSKMAAAAILDFENFTFLILGTVKSAELRHYAQFC